MFHAMRAAAADDRQHRGRAHLLVLGGLVVVAGLLRIHYMDEPMRFDEAYTFYAYAMQSVDHIVSTYDGPNNHVLYSLLVHASWRVLGDHVWVARLPAFLAGLAIVPASYAVARSLYDRRAALWAAALTAVFAPLVDYSVNGRGYTVGVLLLLASLWLGTRLLERPRPWTWVAIASSFGLAFYAVPTMAYGIATVGLWIAAAALARRPPRRVGIALGAVVALAAGAGLGALLYPASFGHRASGFANLLAAHRADVPLVASRVWENWNRAAPHPLDFAVALAFLAGLVLHRRIARHSVPVAAAAVVTLGGIAAVAPISPLPRSWLYLLPLYLITAGAGLSFATGLAFARFGSRDTAVAIASGCAAIVLTIALLHAGMRGAEARPASDNQLVPLLRRLVSPGQHALIDAHVRVPAIYYVHRYGGGGLTGTAVGPSEVAAGHVVVVVPRFVTARAISPLADVRAAGGRPRGSPRLLVRRPWIDFYDVRLAG